MAAQMAETAPDLLEMNIGGDGGATMATSAAGMMGMNRSPFTVSQWQELEHQALIFKYMMAGLPVPPDLVLPIQKSFDSISHRFFHHPTMGYCSFYGKKVDPEPGRCRRTDGKKWRCSKDAYPDSKYCERHMHRGRNRSRKPVESQTMTQTSSSAASLTGTGATAAAAAATGPAAFHNLPFDVLPNSQSTLSGTSHSHYQLDSIPFGIPNKDYRYPQGLKLEVGEHSFFSDASGSNRALQMDAQLDNIWLSRVSSIPAAKSSHNNMIQNEYSGHHSVFNNAYASADLAKPESHSLRPFFDEWPRTRDSWAGLDDERSNQASFSTTQLSISIPMASPDFSASSSRSPHDN